MDSGEQLKDEIIVKKNLNLTPNKFILNNQK